MTEEIHQWMREAATAGSLDQQMQAVCSAVRKKYGDEPGSYTYAKEVFDGFVILQKGDALWRVSYTINADGTVVIADDLQKVKQTYVNLTESSECLVFGPLNEDGSLFTLRESEGGAAPEKPSGRKWGVWIIQEGMSKNRTRYSRKVLTEAATLYEGKPVFLGHAKTLPRNESEGGKVGFLKDVKPAMQLSESAGTSSGRFALAATLVVTRKSVREEMLDAWDEGHELYGLSHDAMTECVVALEGATGKPFHDVTRITAVESVDLVLKPAAGGRLLRLVAGNIVAATLEGDGHMLTLMITRIRESKDAELIARLDALGGTPNETGVMPIYEEAVRREGARATEATRTQEAERQAQATREAEAQRQREAAAAAAGGTGTPTEDRRRLEAMETELFGVRRDGMRYFLDAAVRGTSLPTLVQESMRTQFDGRINSATAIASLPSQTEITEALRAQVELFGRLAEGGIIVPSSRADIRMGDAPLDKINKGLDAFFGVKTESIAAGADGKPRFKYTRIDADPYMSFKELYVGITGDVRVTGRLKESTRLTEALSSTSFDQILGDSITRAMVADYQNTLDLNTWRLIAEVRPLQDFRTQRRMRFGGYGNLSIVGERAPYPALGSPTDEEATYSPAKRGGTESVSLEAIKNDDVGVIRRIPGKLARAALQTLHEFVWDFLANNATIYDAVALAAVGHNNITTTALSASQLSALRLLLKKQTDMNNGKRLALKPTYLIVPSDLEELAFQITNADRAVPDSNLATQAAPAAPNFIQRQGLTPIVVDYWTDTNNYWLTADKGQSPMIEVGFMDGREDPEIFVSDNPSVGSLFTNDVITWKLRHIYGGAVLDYRPFAAGIVP